MLELTPNLAARSGRPLLLCLGAHADDLEIGCGATVSQLLRRYPRARVEWVVLSGRGPRQREARRAAAAVLRRAGQAHVAVHTFRDGYFPTERGAIKDLFESLKQRIKPDLILTHAGGDGHQDHRLVHELTWNTFRDHMILEYEIPKYDGDLGRPQFFVPLSAAAARAKVALLLRHFATQRPRRWFTAETFLALMRLRGIECNAPGGYAEAFYCRKAVLGLKGTRA